MNIRYENTVDSLTEEKLQGFFEGWPKHPDAKTHVKLLKGSFAVWLAFDQDKCVGFINALSDGVFYSYIPLLEVLPEYKGRGIGAELVRRMTKTLKNMYAVDIVCDESVVPFYEKLGFFKCAGMVKRNYENQSGTRE